MRTCIAFVGSLLTALVLSSGVSAESGPRNDAGCFGGLPPNSCTYNSDCEGTHHCFEGTCVCERACDAELRETCTDGGCFCEMRPSCRYHDECTDEGALCFPDGLCYTEVARCEEAVDLWEECTPEGCACEVVPRCQFHYQCFPLLCVNDRCDRVIESCDDDPMLEEQCVYLQGCQCSTRGMDAGPPPPFDAGPSLDGGRLDAGRRDAGPGPDAGRRDAGRRDSGGAGSMDGGNDGGSDGDGGGGCAVTPSSSSAPGAFLALVALIATRRRTRR